MEHQPRERRKLRPTARAIEAGLEALLGGEEEVKRDPQELQAVAEAGPSNFAMQLDSTAPSTSAGDSTRTGFFFFPPLPAAPPLTMGAFMQPPAQQPLQAEAEQDNSEPEGHMAKKQRLTGATALYTILCRMHDDVLARSVCAKTGRPSRTDSSLGSRFGWARKPDLASRCL